MSKEAKTRTTFIGAQPVKIAFAPYRLEVLDAHQFQTIDEARATTEQWLTIYNDIRTHSAIGHLPPKGFKERWQQQQSLLIAGTG